MEYLEGVKSVSQGKEVRGVEGDREETAEGFAVLSRNGI